MNRRRTFDDIDNEREFIRRFVRNVERAAMEHVLGSIVTQQMFGAVNEWEWVRVARSSGLVACYDANSKHGRQIAAAQAQAMQTVHSPDSCDDDECDTCDAYYAARDTANGQYL